MATYLELTQEQQAEPRSAALEWLVAESEQLINYFDWREPSNSMWDEKDVDGWGVEGINSRRINQGFTRMYSAGGRSKLIFPLTNYGGVDVVDPMVVDLESTSRHDRVSKKAARSIGIKWANNLFDATKTGGDKDAMVSLPSYCENMGRVMTPAPTAGAPLNLIWLDQMIQACRRVTNKSFFIVSDKMMTRLSQLARNQAIAGNISMTMDELGAPVIMYNKIPIVTAGKTVENVDRLDYNETTGTSDETTSIYLVYTGDEGVSGLRKPLTDTISNQQYTLLADGSFAPQIIHEVAQPLGIAITTPYAVMQLKGITDAKFVDTL